MLWSVLTTPSRSLGEGAGPRSPVRGKPPLCTPKQTWDSFRGSQSGPALLCDTLCDKLRCKLQHLHLTHEPGHSLQGKRCSAEKDARGLLLASRPLAPPREPGVPFLSLRSSVVHLPPSASSPLCWHRGHLSGQQEGSSAGRLTHPCSWNCLKAGEGAVGSNCIIWAGAGSRWSLLKKKKKYFHVGSK